MTHSPDKPPTKRNATGSTPVVTEASPLVLVVEDDRASALIVRKRLESAGNRVLTAVDGEQGLELAIEHNPDVIVTDWCMPKLDGPSLCEALRRDPSMASAYIIILSSRTEPNERVEGLRRGADDYLGKDKNHEELVARVHAGVRIRTLQKQLTEQARTDGLTGLMNRAHFYDRLNQELERAHRYEERMTLAMIDLDRFKQINDTAGHHAGDEAIRYAASAITRECRGTDLVCRYGGDEFAVLFINAEREKAATILNRIRDQLESDAFHYEGVAYPFGLSFGLCETDPNVATYRDEILRIADEELYEMKRKSSATR